MPTSVAAKITAAGLAAATTASGLGISIAITHVALGAGGGGYTPTGAETSLVDRREKAAVLVGARSGAQITLTVTFLAALYAGAAYNVHEIGFYIGDPDAGGTLFAVISSPGMAGPLRGPGSVTNYTQTFALTLSGVPPGSVTVTFDPTASAALIALAAHIAAADPHPQYALLSSIVTPIGAVQPFYATSAPTGWLALNGAIVNRSDHADLWAYVQAQSLTVAESAWSGSTGLFSTGDGVTTFRLPDLRGEFLRGLDGGRGIDPARALGSTQAQMTQAHKHVMAWGEAGPGPYGNSAVRGYVGSNATDYDNYFWNTNDGTAIDSVAPGNAPGVIGTETRPRNVALLYCIKATAT